LLSGGIIKRNFLFPLGPITYQKREKKKKKSEGICFHDKRVVVRIYMDLSREEVLWYLELSEGEQDFRVGVGEFFYFIWLLDIEID
jgi:hypothetical protein